VQSEGTAGGGEVADFVEALSYSKETMVVMPANFVAASEVEAGKLNRIGRWYGLRLEWHSRRVAQP
jgi:hypothetical protein